MNKNDPCNEVRKLLSLYIDQALSQEEINLVEEHMALCPVCKKEYIEMMEIGELLRAIPDVAIPQQFELRLKRALAEEGKAIRKKGQFSRKTEHRKWNWRILSSMIAVFTVGLISFAALGQFPMGGNTFDNAAQMAPQYGTIKQYKEMSSLKVGSLEEETKQTDKVAQSKKQSKEILGASSRANTQVSNKDNEINQDNNVPKENMANEDNAKNVMPKMIIAPTGGGANEQTMAAPMNISNDSALQDVEGAAESDVSFKYVGPQSVSTGDAIVEGQGTEYQMYVEQLAEKLKDFDYEITDSTYNNGEWHFVVFIFNGKDGKIIEKEIEVVGKSREIEVLYADEFMGL